MERLGHEGRRLAVAQGDGLDDVLGNLDVVAGQQRLLEAELDLDLPRPAELVMVVLHRHAALPQRPDDVGAQLVQVVTGRSGMLADGTSQMVAGVRSPLVGVRVPARFLRVDHHRLAVLRGRVAHIVEDVELELRQDHQSTLAGDRAQALDGAPQDAARAAAELAAVGVADGAEDVEGLRLGGGVEEGRRQVGDHAHVRGLDRAVAGVVGHARPRARREQLLVDRRGREAELSREAVEVGDAEVHHLHARVAYPAQQLDGRVRDDGRERRLAPAAVGRRNHGHVAMKPPSTSSSAPVTQEASSLARYRAA